MIAEQKILFIPGQGTAMEQGTEGASCMNTSASIMAEGEGASLEVLTVFMRSSVAGLTWCKEQGGKGDVVSQEDP